MSICECCVMYVWPFVNLHESFCKLLHKTTDLYPMIEIVNINFMLGDVLT